jgi:hypothetical protein
MDRALFGGNTLRITTLFMDLLMRLFERLDVFLLKHKTVLRILK